MKAILSVILLFISIALYANDGAFFASGNQLIPISETDISVQKEILMIKKIDNKYIQVSVYYEFFNPGKTKEIIVGFEARSPEGDVNGAPKNGNHPYMYDFTADLNNEKLKYQVAYVADSLYNDNGKIKSIDLDTFQGNQAGNYVDFFYVYHFKAKFKKGKNIIKHTYRFDVSAGIDYNYDFDYVLTAANRWANKQIDDFTLHVEMEDFEVFSINKTFFNQASDWQIEGIGKAENVQQMKNSPIEVDAVKFYMQEGKLVFKKKNFRPAGELQLYSFNYWIEKIASDVGDYYLPFSVYQQDRINVESPSDRTKKILRNLPYARRGYVFRDEDLKSYYSDFVWYMPNPDYVPDPGSLWKQEKYWIKQWK